MSTGFSCEYPCSPLSRQHSPYPPRTHAKARRDEHFVASVPDHGALLREGLERVARDEPGRLHVVLFEQLEETADADGARPHPAGDVAGGVFAAVGAEPAGDGVDVDAIGAEDACGGLADVAMGGLGTCAFCPF